MNGNVKNTLDGYGLKAVSEAIRILAVIEKNGLKIDALLAYEKEEKKERKRRILSAARRNRPTRREIKRASRKRRAENPILSPGQSEILLGAKCEQCDGKLHSEALCSKTARKEKCIRIATCVECSKEVKIR